MVIIERLQRMSSDEIKEAKLYEEVTEADHDYSVHNGVSLRRMAKVNFDTILEFVQSVSCLRSRLGRISFLHELINFIFG